jgi:hypothetical protein
MTAEEQDTILSTFQQILGYIRNKVAIQIVS